MSSLLCDLAKDQRSLTREQRNALLVELERHRRWLAAREAVLLACAAGEGDDVASGSKGLRQHVQTQAEVSFGEASATERRCRWVDHFPSLGQALEAGEIGAGQLNEVTLLAERLNRSDLPALDDAIDGTLRSSRNGKCAQGLRRTIAASLLKS